MFVSDNRIVGDEIRHQYFLFGVKVEITGNEQTLNLRKMQKELKQSTWKKNKIKQQRQELKENIKITLWVVFLGVLVALAVKGLINIWL